MRWWPWRRRTAPEPTAVPAPKPRPDSDTGVTSVDELERARAALAAAHDRQATAQRLARAAKPVAEGLREQTSRNHFAGLIAVALAANRSSRNE